MKSNSIVCKATLLALAAALAPNSFAEPRGFHREPDHPEAWRGEIHRFHEHDIDVWRGGRWMHGRHDGRLGWWWIVGGVWYFYPAPVYPYPDPYQPPVVAVPPAAAAPPYWYYCSNPAGYYPYVPSCPAGWQRVEANAPSAPPPSPPAQ